MAKNEPFSGPSIKMVSVSNAVIHEPLYVGSLKGYRDKGGVRGGIYDLNKPPKHHLVCVIYGRTMKEMRARKQLLLKALKEAATSSKPLSPDTKT